MGFFNNLVNSAGRQLGSNIVGGQKVRVKQMADVKGETKIAEAQANAQIKQAEAQVALEAKKATIEAVNLMRFDGSADEISENINALFSMYKQTAEGAGSAIGGALGSMPFGSMYGNIAGAFKSDTDRIRDAILEKIDFGLMKLRKLDEESTEFFQKKLNDIKNPPKKGMFGLGRR